MQPGRIVLSPRAGPAVLAEYNLAAQMFTPVWAVVSAGGITLWSSFARARASGRPVSPFATAWVFAAAAAAMAGAVALASPLLADLASGGEIAPAGPPPAPLVLLLRLPGLK